MKPPKKSKKEKKEGRKKEKQVTTQNYLRPHKQCNAKGGGAKELNNQM